MQEKLQPINDFLNLLKDEGFDYLIYGVTSFNLTDKNIPSTIDDVDLSLICKDIKKHDLLNILKKYYVLGTQLKDNRGKYEAYQKLLDLLLARAALFNITPSELMQSVSEELIEKSQGNNANLCAFFNDYLEIKTKSKFVFFDNDGKLIVCNSLEEAHAKCHEALKEKIHKTNDAYTEILTAASDLLSDLSGIVSEKDFDEEEESWKELLGSPFGGRKFKTLISRIEYIYQDLQKQGEKFKQKHKDVINKMGDFLERYSKIVNDKNIEVKYNENQDLPPIEIVFGTDNEWGVFRAKSVIYQVKPEFIQRFQYSDVYRSYSCRLQATCDLKHDEKSTADIGYNIIYNKQSVLSESDVNPQYKKVLALEKYISELDKKYNSIICFDRENVKYKISIMKDLFIELDQLAKDNNFDFSPVIKNWKKKQYIDGEKKYGTILAQHRNVFSQALNFTKDKKDKIPTKAEKVVNNLTLKNSH